MFWLRFQEATEVSYVATMKTVRQVKTVFIIFIAFVCCWSPYIVVLLYDTSDSLPLPVHLYASTLAHLHASLNFAIYGLMNPNLRTNFVMHLLVCCRPVTSKNAAAAAAQHRSATGTGYNRVNVNELTVGATETTKTNTSRYLAMSEVNLPASRFQQCKLVTEQRECHTTIASAN